MGYIYCCLNDEGEEKVHKTRKRFFSLKATVGKLFLHAPKMFFLFPLGVAGCRSTQDRFLFYLLM